MMAEKRKKEPVLKVCKMCGSSFYGYSASKFCKDCAKVRKAQRQDERNQKTRDIDTVEEALKNASEIKRQELERQSKKGLVPPQVQKMRRSLLDKVK